MSSDNWAASAFTQSYLDSYSTLYGCQTFTTGNYASLRYGAKIPAKMEDCEVFSLDQNPVHIQQAVENLPLAPCEQYILNVFHSEAETGDIEKRFEAAGFQYAFTNVVRGLPLPTTRQNRGIRVEIITQPEQVAYVNLTHQFFQPVPETALSHPKIRAFFAELNGQAAGWGLLVTTAQDASYISDMFTLPSFRGRGVAEALLGAMHEESGREGKRYSLLVPSIMAWNYYQRFGYETLTCFSIFHQISH